MSKKIISLIKSFSASKARGKANDYVKEVIKKYETENLVESIINNIKAAAEEGLFEYQPEFNIKDIKEKEIIAKHIRHELQAHGEFRVTMSTVSFDLVISWAGKHH